MAIDATGAYIAFLENRKPARGRGLFNLFWLLRLKDQAVFPIIMPGAVYNFQWSVRGSRLATVIGTHNGSSLYLFDPTRACATRTAINHPRQWAWSADGQTIAYVTGDTHYLCLYSLPSKREVYRWHLAEPTDATPSFLASGKLLAFQERAVYEAVKDRPLQLLSTHAEKVQTGQVIAAPTDDSLALETFNYESSDDPLSTIPSGVDRSILVYKVKDNQFHVLRTWTASAPFSPPSDKIISWSRDSRFLILAHPIDNNADTRVQLIAIDSQGICSPLFTSAVPVSSIDWHESK